MGQTGAVEQRKRIRILDDFRAGKLRVLVATDVAGRGIHVDEISHVINFDLPQSAEDYVHRIGRTGRAGAAGTAISFASGADALRLRQIESFIHQSLPEVVIPGLEPTRSLQASHKTRAGRGCAKSSRRHGGPGSSRHKTVHSRENGERKGPVVEYRSRKASARKASSTTR